MYFKHQIRMNILISIQVEALIETLKSYGHQPRTQSGKVFSYSMVNLRQLLNPSVFQHFA